MADDLFDNFRLSVMQDFLPVGIAMMARAREGGASKLVEVFQSSGHPIKDLRKEGEPAAKSVRDRLDQIVPGLGNPVISVSVGIDYEEELVKDFSDKEDLLVALKSIDTKLHALERYISDGSGKYSSTSLPEGSVNG